MKSSLHWSLVIIVFLLSPLVQFQVHAQTKVKTKVLFEGFYKVNLYEKHVGYFVQRYAIDPKKKHFISTYYFRTGPAAGNISESLKAVSTDKLVPIEYQYTSLKNKTTKTIDAKVTKGNMVLKITNNGKLKTQQTRLQSGVFFSTFLSYLVLQGKKGISPGVKYEYQAIAEEDGKIYPGSVFVEKEEKYRGLSVFKILNTFKRDQFVNYISANGSSIRSHSPKAGFGVELTATAPEAIGQLAYNASSLKLLFGNDPLGVENPISKKALAPSKPIIKKLTPPKTPK